MREIWVGTGTSGLAEEAAITCEYYILVRELEAGSFCESYGIKVVLTEANVSAEIPDITVSAARVQALVEGLHRNLVTPCTLRDVLEDWL